MKPEEFLHVFLDEHPEYNRATAPGQCAIDGEGTRAFLWWAYEQGVITRQELTPLLDQLDDAVYDYKHRQPEGQLNTEPARLPR